MCFFGFSTFGLVKPFDSRNLPMCASERCVLESRIGLVHLDDIIIRIYGLFNDRLSLLFPLKLLLHSVCVSYRGVTSALSVDRNLPHLHCLVYFVQAARPL